MTLFEECKEALSADFSVLDGQSLKDAMDILNEYPFSSGGVVWSEMKSSDYESIDDLLSENLIKKSDVFVFADDTSIPIFRTKLNLIAENVYDVTALSPKLFIFNDEVILQPLFPTEMIRLGIKAKL
ncbi:hypothetical protein CWC46_12980 [Prodigiosinella confusarubida]|uniref:Uncharacterized protein n=1 Tax=Serratia sp. (strain ATCC 39006) TaxID=104623 RepID=A0A2I5T7V7_SERS3|nr:hypothetical protein [Serratia sp. ATCC 39006]AUH00636.1 hypothetical protein CWC46_12980 [Serratia sp. ATCC 39006]AUH04957.1 hypothetical protein Ser39006_012985 [Serratia sp. ATCC 39006]